MKEQGIKPVFLIQVLRLLLGAEGRSSPASSCALPSGRKTRSLTSKLRQALEDSVERPKFVETLPRFGYRFIVSVE